ncbi:MAG: UDP-N-acetylmuramoyl-L-alanyl-D-glutamate--2,6-diaminopimelate ligase [bacterium]
MHADFASIARALDEAGLLIERRGALAGAVSGTFSGQLSGITDDSRAVRPGYLFIAVRGTDRDGHDYLDAAAQAGAMAVIVQDASRTKLPSLVVNDGRRAAAIAGAEAYGWPARELQLVGVTGTNGKTTTVNMLRHLLDDGNSASASIGTLGVLVGSDGIPFEGGGGLTTPGPVELQRLFRALLERGVRRIAMEVSSHSLDQRRVEGVFFDVVTFTNLTRDHLDYHGTMEKYFAAKSMLLDHLLPSGSVVYNADDLAWASLGLDRRRFGFSERTTHTDVRADDVRYSARGSEWTLCVEKERAAVRLPLIGDFNIANALGAAASAHAIGLPVSRIAERLSTMPQVPGRLEVLRDAPTVLRDYSHTPDSLARALDAVRPFTPERLIVVFGCGGDRDRGKRPLMGAIAEERADFAIVTSDNPRTEDPEAIIDDVERGMTKQNHERIEDRRAAIARALELATSRDVIVLAGKGHETYQVRGTTKLPFDERIIVHELSSRVRATE